MIQILSPESSVALCLAHGLTIEQAAEIADNYAAHDNGDLDRFIALLFHSISN